MLPDTITVLMQYTGEHNEAEKVLGSFRELRQNLILAITSIRLITIGDPDAFGNAAVLKIVFECTPTDLAFMKEELTKLIPQFEENTTFAVPSSILLIRIFQEDVEPPKRRRRRKPKPEG